MECSSEKLRPEPTPTAAITNDGVAEIYAIWVSPDDDVHEIIDSIPFLRLQEITEDDARIVDIDADVGDPSLCADIFKNLRSMETKKRPTPDYMETLQTQIDSQTRARCVDLVIEAAGILRCVASAPHLAVNCMDRYLSGNNVDIKNLCRVALSCLMIASICDGVITDFDFDAYKYLCEGAISGREFVETEASILKYLKYDVMAPTAYTFLDRFVRAARCGRRGPAPPPQGLEHMAAYVAEVSLLSTDMLRFPPSMVAASSVLLAQYVLDPHAKPWNATLRHYAVYEACDLRDCVSALLDLCGDESCRLPAVTTKYSKEEYGRVSLTSFPPFIPPHVFDEYEIFPSAKKTMVGFRDTCFKCCRSRTEFYRSDKLICPP